MLEEDLDEERFFATVRRGLLGCARRVAGAHDCLQLTLIQTLEF